MSPTEVQSTSDNVKAEVQDPEALMKSLVAKGKKKGFLTYEEINESLPDDAVSAKQLEKVLSTLDEVGITLIDESDAEAQALTKGEARNSKRTPRRWKRRRAPEAEVAESEEDEVLEKEFVEGEVSHRIDDPIRMYLTQMGQIPLLTRKDEISLARKIEIARMVFRRKMLQCDYCARNAVELLQQVFDGSMSFDRTIKTGTAPLTTKGVIKKRMTENLKTVAELLDIDQKLFKSICTCTDEAKVRGDVEASASQSPQDRDAAGGAEPADQPHPADEDQAAGRLREDAPTAKDHRGRRQRHHDGGRYPGRQAGVGRLAGIGPGDARSVGEEAARHGAGLLRSTRRPSGPCPAPTCGWWSPSPRSTAIAA